MSNFSEKVAFIWSVADLLRGPYKPAQYGRVILPLTVLRRLDCVLEPTKAKVLEKHAALKDSKIKEPEPILNKVAGHAFHNTSKLNFQKLKGEPGQGRTESVALHQELLVQGAAGLRILRVREGDRQAG